MPKPKPMTDAQARVAIVQALDVSMFVEAGAGSGKTTSLANRMVAVIQSGRCTVDRMAAITFTRKAAAELRGKFQVALEHAARTAADSQAAQPLHEALTHLEQLFTGTIHAFCGRLLRERPVEADVPPGFEEIEDDRDAEIRRQAWHQYIAGLNAAGDDRLARLTEAGVSPGDLEEAFASVCLYPEVDFPAPATEPPDPVLAVRDLQYVVKALTKALPEKKPEVTKCPLQQTIINLLRGLSVTNPQRAADVARLLGRCKAIKKPTYKWWQPRSNDDVDAALALYESFRVNTVEPYLMAWRAYVYHVALTVLLPAREAAAEARKRLGVLNYQDLLLKTAAVLRKNPEVRAYFRDRFRCLFVDEFQDTDPVQAEVILFLGGDSDTETDWTRIRPRPGSLFVVGDPKQSIYRFRRADIDTYQRVREIIKQGGGEVVTLTKNYRSAGRLCHWLNTVFEGTFPQEATPEQAAFAPLDPYRPEGDAGRTGVRTLTTPDDVDYKDVPEREAAAIARFIDDAVRNQRLLEGGSADLPGSRPIRYGDVLILTRIKRNVAVYARALEDRGIPQEVGGGGAFSAAGPLQALVNLLQALADPDDAVTVVGALRGPLFGVTDDDLYGHYAAGHAFRFLVPGLDAISGPVGEGLRTLAEAYRATRALPVAAAVERILDMTGLLAWAASGEGGDTAAGNLQRAADRMRLRAEAGGSFADCVDALARDLNANSIEALGLEPGRRDVVRVMNLHKAKGLEAPIVFLADPCIGSPGGVDIRVTRSGDHPLGYMSIAKSVGDHGWELIGQPTDWNHHEAAEQAYLQAEETRLRYVAATRARDLLVIGRFCGKSRATNPPPWEPFSSFLAGIAELEIPPQAALATYQAVDLSPSAEADAMAAREAEYAQASTPTCAVKSVTEAISSGCHDTGGVRERPQALKLGDDAEDVPAGPEWGTLIHAMLQTAMQAPHHLSEDDLRRLATFLTAESPALRSRVGDAVLTIKSVMTSDMWRRARSSFECYTEVPFAIGVPTEQVGETAPHAPAMTLLHGVIDLVYRIDGGWEIVDYKTDKADLNSLVELYGDQVRQYATHWAAVTGTPVTYAGLYSVRHDTLTPNLMRETA